MNPFAPCPEAAKCDRSEGQQRQPKAGIYPVRDKLAAVGLILRVKDLTTAMTFSAGTATSSPKKNLLD
jgi:hypothetical protein